MFRLSGCLAVFLVFVRIGSAQADAIAGLYNTGVADDGSTLPDRAVDPHYALIEVPSGSGLGQRAYVVDSSGVPIGSGNWQANSGTAKWIAHHPDQGSNPHLLIG